MGFQGHRIITSARNKLARHWSLKARVSKAETTNYHGITCAAASDTIGPDTEKSIYDQETISETLQDIV